MEEKDLRRKRIILREKVVNLIKVPMLGNRRRGGNLTAKEEGR